MATEVNRSRLFKTLSELPEAQLEELLFTLNVPRQNISSNAAPQATRVGEFLDWATSPIGCGLNRIVVLANQLFAIGLQQLESDEKGFPVNNLPQLSVPLIGREHDLNRIHEQLQNSEQSTFLGLVGMPGVGKSELALHYAHIYGHYYSGGICWVDARENDIAAQIVQFARRIGLTPLESDEPTQQLGHCWQNWPNSPQPTLIIIDDVDSYENQIKKCCRGLNSRFKFLVTSRQHLGRPVKLISLELPTSEQAVAIFGSILQEDTRLEEEREALIDLCEWAGH